MASVGAFEDLQAWKKARDLNKIVYRLTAQGMFSRDFGLRDQIRRSSISVMSNIAEGFERGGPVEFHRFLVIAKGSCAELRSQLYAALDVGYLDKSAFESTMALAQEVSRVLGGLRAAVKKRTIST